jgi:hypothetical protein
VHDLTDERIDIQTLFQALYNVKFLEQIPLVSHHYQAANADDIYCFVVPEPP